MDPDDPDHSQNLINRSLSHLGHFLKMLSKPIHNFFRYRSLKIHFMDPEDPFCDADHFQNSIISSFYLFRNNLKISSKSVHNFLVILFTRGILDPDDPVSNRDHSQNLVTCSSSHFGHFLKMSSKCVPKFFSYVFKNYISWIQKIQIVIRIIFKIESFLPFPTYPENFIKIDP